MEITVKRRFSGDKYTIGSMSVDGKYLCDTLEPPVRVVKIKGNTAIPTGRYSVIVTKSPRFGRELPRLQSVPNFEGVLIHRGNMVKDTAGCILIGENKEVGKVINSTTYELAITQKIKDAAASGQKCNITII